MHVDIGCDEIDRGERCGLLGRIAPIKLVLGSAKEMIAIKRERS
jgi:hypothetical protein